MTYENGNQSQLEKFEARLRKLEEAASAERVVQAILEVGRRLVRALRPREKEVVGTGFVAKERGVTPTRVAQMAANGEIPSHCIVDGSGNGKPWKFHKRPVLKWLKSL